MKPKARGASNFDLPARAASTHTGTTERCREAQLEVRLAEALTLIDSPPPSSRGDGDLRAAGEATHQTRREAPGSELLGRLRRTRRRGGHLLSLRVRPHLLALPRHVGATDGEGLLHLVAVALKVVQRLARGAAAGATELAHFLPPDVLLGVVVRALHVDEQHVARPRGARLAQVELCQLPLAHLVAQTDRSECVVRAHHVRHRESARVVSRRATHRHRGFRRRRRRRRQELQLT
mmetsp:Transcript_9799/g.21896  ORF Transcript_9799/g.21896 Transcript_9799/m.21896 type:complete len:235 (-) Transcript_9799:195-899(-)